LINEEKSEEKTALIEILNCEKSHRQWSKHFICIFCYLILLGVNLLRGGKGLESPIDLVKCSFPDWTLQLIFVITCILITRVALKWNQHADLLKAQF
jgi:hypothetical protein